MHAAGFASYELDSYDGSFGDLPSVDDLEVAAAAAAAAMEAVDMASGPAEGNEEVLVFMLPFPMCVASLCTD